MRYAALLFLIAIACMLMLSCIATVTTARDAIARPSRATHATHNEVGA